MPADRDTALAHPAPPPVPKLASSLASARSHDLVALGRGGQVLSPERYRLAQITGYGRIALLTALVGTLYYMLLGGLGAAAVVAVMALALGFSLSRVRALQHGQRLLLAERFDEATQVFERLSRRRPRRVRASAQLNLALCRALAGRHEEALALYRSARGGFGRDAVRDGMAARGEVLALVHLGRVGEARQRLDALGGEPGGEYLRVVHWTTELYVSLAEGKHAFGADELHRRARAALEITSAGALLGLLAWAFDQQRDEDMAVHLAAEAIERNIGHLGARRLALLQTWLDARGAELAAKREPLLDES